MKFWNVYIINITKYILEITVSNIKAITLKIQFIIYLLWIFFIIFFLLIFHNSFLAEVCRSIIITNILCFFYSYSCVSVPVQMNIGTVLRKRNRKYLRSDAPTTLPPFHNPNLWILIFVLSVVLKKSPLQFSFVLSQFLAVNLQTNIYTFIWL